MCPVPQEPSWLWICSRGFGLTWSLLPWPSFHPFLVDGHLLKPCVPWELDISKTSSCLPYDPTNQLTSSGDALLPVLSLTEIQSPYTLKWYTGCRRTVVGEKSHPRVVVGKRDSGLDGPVGRPGRDCLMLCCFQNPWLWHPFGTPQCVLPV